MNSIRSHFSWVLFNGVEPTPTASRGLTSKKVKFEWTQEHQKAFDDIKSMIAKETLLTYPDLANPFTCAQMQVKYS